MNVNLYAIKCVLKLALWFVTQAKECLMSGKLPIDRQGSCAQRHEICTG